MEVYKRLGGWPVLMKESWDLDSSWNWVKSVRDFRKVGYSIDYIIDFSVSIDLKQSTKRIIDVSIFIYISIFYI